MTRVRDGGLSDIEQIVAIHKAAFEGFFLTELGGPFLRELYKSYMTRSGGLLRVLTDSEQGVVGFAAGASNPEEFYSLLRKDKAIVFLLKAIPSLIRRPILVIKKMWYAMFYKGERPVSRANAALLSSIAVSPDMVGRSLGSVLLSDYENIVLGFGVDSLFLTTDEVNNEGVISFYVRNGYVLESSFVQTNGRKMLRFSKMLSRD